MKILTDIHSHTMDSSHAYSTLLENVAAAKEKGLELLSMTNHGPAMEDAPHLWHFINVKSLPPVINGVKMLYGAEANVLNPEGELDIPEDVLKGLGIVIASLHGPTYNANGKTNHTESWLNVIKNPYVDILGHIGRGNYPFDHDAVISAAKENDVCIEVNRYTITKENQRDVCRDIIMCCKKHEAKIVIGSDAHFCSQIGMFDDALSLLLECDFPEELIVSRNADTLINHLKNKNKYFNYSFQEIL